ncbi:hypothetical protein BHM03_00047696 [Ensete ventricosum]|nr:hypothetical protein BHM03_00047696 [Ensete ventricosum]
MDPNGAGSSHHPSQPYASVSGSTSHCETGGGYAKAHKRTSRRNQVTGRDERKERSDRFTVGIAPLEEYISSPKASALRHSMSSLSTTTTAHSTPTSSSSSSLSGAETGDYRAKQSVQSPVSDCTPTGERKSGRGVTMMAGKCHYYWC